MTPGAPPIDVVVIGSGAGGAFAAMALAEAGARVLLLERGRRFDPRRDFPMTHPDWEIRPDPFAETADGRDDPSLVVEEGPPLDPRYARLRSSGGSEGTDAGRRRPFRYWRVFGLGGSTVHYQGEAHRFPEHAFRPATAYGFGVNWPLAYADLAPHYEQAEQVLGVAGDPANPFKAPRGPFPTPAHPLSYGSRRIADGAARLGWSLLPNSLALPTRSRDGRPPCQWSGGCLYGCIFGAKSSADLTAIPRGERTGRLRTLVEARALALEPSPDGKVAAVVYRHAGTLARARPRAVVLALGAIETPRLLLASRSAPHRDGMANSSGLVGRYLMETVYALLNVRFDARIDAHRGPPVDSRLWDFARPRPGGRARSGYVLGVSGTAGGFHGSVSYAIRTPGFGKAHKDAMRARFGTVLALFGVAEQEPRAANRLGLAAPMDPDGIPRARVETAHSEADLVALDEMLGRLRDLATASGAAEVLEQITSYDAPSATHVGGTCRMGTDPSRSVVDPLGRAHDVPNLFIADASVLPGQGAGDSPSLTIQALALRTAEHMARLARRREL